jgi:protein gp37
MENTGISWAHQTQNFWMGCDKVAPECRHCYIDEFLRKHGHEPWGEVIRCKTTWDDPHRWEIDCAINDCAKRVFTCSLSDFFHDGADEWRNEAWRIIKKSSRLVWLILTKRPSLIAKRLPADWGEGYPNVWLGVSTGCNARLKQMDVLRKIPCALRWVSTEPLLEDISQQINLDGFGWVVTGGESGFGDEYLYNPADNWRVPPAREMVMLPGHLDDPTVEYSEIPHVAYTNPGRRTMLLTWAENLRDVTKAAGLPFMFKQVTAPNSGVGVNALGRDWHEFPDAPNGLKWAPRNPIDPKNEWTPVQIEEYKRTGGIAKKQARKLDRKAKQDQQRADKQKNKDTKMEKILLDATPIDMSCGAQISRRIARENKHKKSTADCRRPFFAKQPQTSRRTGWGLPIAADVVICLGSAIYRKDGPRADGKFAVMLSNSGVWQSIFSGTDAEVEARLSELGEKQAEIDELDSAHGRQRDRRRGTMTVTRAELHELPASVSSGDN